MGQDNNNAAATTTKTGKLLLLLLPAEPAFHAPHIHAAIHDFSASKIKLQFTLVGL